jgi:proton glutamate symport protein
MLKKSKFPWKIFLAIILAISIGKWTGTQKEIFGVAFYTLFDVIGNLFIRALTLIVVPLVSSSIITGVARIGNEGSFGRLSIKTFAFYIGTSLLAILIGLFFVDLIKPGAFQVFNGPSNSGLNVEMLEQREGTLLPLLLTIIPANIVDVFHGPMMGLIFFSLLFGYAISRIEARFSSTLFSFWQGIFQTMLKITEIVMKFLPLGVFCLVAKVFATTGMTSIKSVSLFVLTVMAGFIVFFAIGLPLILKCIGGVSPLRHLRAMAPALVAAFSTSSSSATLPITMECVEKRAGVSNRICSLVVPLGTSINMSGSALYECVAAIFIAQAYGIDLSFSTQFLVICLALLASMGTAGIPSGSLVAVIVILKAIGLPVEGIGLFIAVDRILDMCRTTVNVFSDSCCAVLVARSEGEKVLSGK